MIFQQEIFPLNKAALWQVSDDLISASKFVKGMYV